MISEKLTVMIKNGCPYCDMALSLLDENELPYILLVLNEDFSREEFYQMVPGAKTFPQIIINGKSIGGYEELTAEITNWI